jgi:hypothetical protein
VPEVPMHYLVAHRVGVVTIAVLAVAVYLVAR